MVSRNKQVTLEDLPKIKLDVGERLELFNESPSSDDQPPFYKKGWRNVKSMWEYRWEPNDRSEYCKSLAWLKDPIQLCKLVKSFKDKGDYTPTNELLNTINKYNKYYEVTYLLQGHSRQGYHDHTTLGIYILKTETQEEFKKRKKWQESYINKILIARGKEEKENKERKKKKDLQQLKRLKRKYEGEDK